MICKDSMIYGYAKICGHARVFDKSNIYGHAMVYGEATIFEHAKVCDQVKVYGNAIVRAYAMVFGNTEIKKGTITGDTNCNFDDIVFIQCENRLITIYKKDNEYYCNIGCQYNMSLDMLRKRIEEDGGMKPHRERYIKLMENIKNIM